MFRLLEDLGNLKQIDSDIISFFYRDVKRSPGSLSPGGHRVPRDPDEPYDWNRDYEYTKSLISNLGEGSPVGYEPLEPSKVFNILKRNVFIVFIVNGLQIAFMYRRHDDTVSFYKTPRFYQVFSDDDMQRSKSILSSYETKSICIHNRSLTREKWLSGDQRNVIKKNAIKEISAFIQKLSMDVPYDCSILTVGEDKNRKNFKTDPRRPPAPGEYTFSYYQSEVKRDLEERLKKFKANKHKFSSPEEILAAAKRGDLLGLESISVFDNEYRLDKIHWEDFGLLLAKAFSKVKAPSDDGTKPAYSYTMHTGKSEGTTADGVIIPYRITVYYSIQGGSITVSHITFKTGKETHDFYETLSRTSTKHISSLRLLARLRP